MLTPGREPCRRAGFTLVEVLVTTVLLGVLALVALPSLEAPLLRARRGDAWHAALQVQLAQERLRSQQPRYGTLADLGLPTLVAGGRYRMRIDAADDTGYSLTAEAIGSQVRDQRCRWLRLRGGRGAAPVRTSGPDPALANPESENRRCWGE